MNDYDNEEVSSEELENREKEATEIAENNIDETANEVETELNTQNKMAELSAEKAIIDLLLKKKKIVIFAVIAGIFGVFLILVAVMTGSKVNEYQYIEPKCTNVTINYDPFGPDEGSTTTMSLEDYVKKATYAYANEYTSENADNIHIYASLAISLRTEVLANNCIVTYHDKNLNDNFEENKSIEKALEIASGVVMVDENDNYINSKVSSFCWNNNENEEYTLFQSNLKVPNTFTNIYLNNDIYKNCPCNSPQGDAFDEDNPYSECWITWDSDDDGIDDKSEWLHQENETGYSFYGAGFLLKNHGFLFNDILKYFYGDKIYLKTTIEGTKEIDSGNKNCQGGGVPYDSTPLTRQEFINLVEEFFASGNYASYSEYFVSYAGEIYDMGKEKGINPELIYIFARKETSFRTVSSDTEHYNYYGMGHCNTCATGMFFDSFMEGVEYLFDYFVEKGSLQAIVQNYSYLGDYLYNFDEKQEQGTGGCYYLEIIYGDNYSRCDDSYYCSPSNTANCLPTTDEEKLAYINWQAEKYVEHRQAIFKLSGNVCSGSEIATDADLYIPANQLKEPLRDYLNSKGLSITDLNSTILNNVIDAGVGTREGVAAAAISLINYMNELGVRIPYTYGGSHGGVVAGVSNEAPTSYYGVDPDWGTPIGNYYSGKVGPYTHLGPDCSGFVAWALHNGGVKINMNTATSFKSLGTNHVMDGSYVGKIGDVVSSGSHVRIIVAVNEQEKYYITAESQTREAPYTPEFKGISYKKMDFVTNNYVIVDMSSFYDNNSKNYSQNEAEFINLYNSKTLN